MKTSMLKKKEIDKNWVLIDAKNKVLGRLASKIAMILMGKNKVSYTPHMDCGDNVIVINAKDVVVSGNKEQSKVYRKHTNWPGGLKEINLKSLREKKPEEVVKLAVKRMLPHNNLGRKMFKNLKVYAGSEHKQHAQKPAESKY